MNLELLHALKKKSACISYVVNHTCLRIHRLECPLEPIADPIRYLQQASLYPKVLWKAKHSSEITLALGSIYRVTKIPNLHTTEERSLPRFFGGLFFDSRCASNKRLWEEFSPCSFFIPQIEIVLREKPVLYYQYLEEDKEDPIKPFLQQTVCSLPTFNPSCVQRINTPSEEQWNHLVKQALNSFTTTPLKKVVLARASHFLYSTPLNPLSILDHLSKRTHNCTLFAYLPSPTCGFIGATPEYLYQRKGLSLLTEAVAGTRPCGSIPEEEEHFLQELLSADKEQREFGYVTSFLTSVLNTLCTHHTKSSSTQVLKTSSLQHLYQTFHGILNTGIRDQELIKALHPTPALGGFPQNLALDFLSAHEPFSRGHYAAPLGWISPEKAEIIVAIRSGLIKKSIMTLFSGAGIVPGSHPKQEWEELELKIAPFLSTYGS
jgi:menaquinone-specific isochorismate synthase